MAFPCPDESTRRVVQILASFAWNATYHANLVGHFLEVTGLIPPRRQRRRKPVALPTRFLLELAAVLRLAAWERQGFRGKLPIDLPTAEEAFDDLLRRRTAETPPSPNDADPPLLKQVVMTWFTCFAWNGWEELQVDVLLDADSERQLVEELADYLWKHRRTGTI